MSNNFDLNRYSTAESKLILAEPKYDIENSKYSTFKKSCYDNMVESSLKTEAEQTTEKMKDSYDTETSKIKGQLSSYNGLLISFRNLSDLYRKYKKENSDLFKKLKNGTHDILTNERQTYYEDQEIDVLNNYYLYILWIIYIIVVVCFVVFSIIYPSQSSFIVRILILCVFILLPFVSTWILGKIIQLIYWLFGFIPKNVYK
jgi:hypothetical protein